jgi:PleD family two-component response regulator
VTLARAISADLPIAGTRLVALTSPGRTSTEELKLANIDTYLIKPVKQSRLLDCLASAGGETPVGDRIAKSDEPASQADPQSGKILILLAEDNRTNQRVSHALLHKLGYEADIVAHGLAALEALKASLRYHLYGLSDAADGRLRRHPRDTNARAKFRSGLSPEISRLNFRPHRQRDPGRSREVSSRRDG